MPLVPICPHIMYFVYTARMVVHRHSTSSATSTIQVSQQMTPAQSVQLTPHLMACRLVDKLERSIAKLRNERDVLAAEVTGLHVVSGYCMLLCMHGCTVVIFHSMCWIQVQDQGCQSA